jgi:quercetin dioxygenase-like cupin family protein
MLCHTQLISIRIAVPIGQTDTIFIKPNANSQMHKLLCIDDKTKRRKNACKYIQLVAVPANELVQTTLQAQYGKIRLQWLPPARLNALILHFEPSARTAWHTHPLGQTLHITQGSGLICKRGEKPQKIQAGDSVWIPANIEHWHGAGLTTHMTHIAIQETKEGSAAMWLEHVTDQDYKA